MIKESPNSFTFVRVISLFTIAFELLFELSKGYLRQLYVYEILNTWYLDTLRLYFVPDVLWLRSQHVAESMVFSWLIGDAIFS